MGNEALFITGFLSFMGIFVAIIMRHTKSELVKAEALEEKKKNPYSLNHLCLKSLRLSLITNHQPNR